MSSYFILRQYDLRVLLIRFVQNNLLADHLHNLRMCSLGNHLCDLVRIVETVLQYRDLE